jgi:UDP-N-acetylmuramoyl-tripeptide--D-alanyl-D-alanine ligase
MLILGDMRELGKSSAEEHQKTVDSIGQMGIDQVWLVGDEFGKTQCNYRKLHDVEEAKGAIQAEHPQGFTILVKGSNSTRLYQLPALL